MHPTSVDWLRLGPAIFIMLSADFFATTHHSFDVLAFIATFAAIVECARLPFEAKVRSRTYYGLTDQRVILAQRRSRDAYQSIDLAHLGEMKLDMGGTNFGTITFRTHESTREFRSGFYGARSKYAAFEYIENARSVYELLKAAEQAAIRRPALSVKPV